MMYAQQVDLGVNSYPLILSATSSVYVHFSPAQSPRKIGTEHVILLIKRSMISFQVR